MKKLFLTVAILIFTGCEMTEPDRYEDGYEDGHSEMMSAMQGNSCSIAEVENLENENDELFLEMEQWRNESIRLGDRLNMMKVQNWNLMIRQDDMRAVLTLAVTDPRWDGWCEDGVIVAWICEAMDV